MMTDKHDAPLSIRLADESDLPTLYELASASLCLDTFRQDLLAEKLFANPRPDEFKSWTYLAEVDGRGVGMMQGVARQSQSKGWLGMFTVPEEHRRQGIATALFERILADLQSLGVAEMEALAIPNNYFTPGLDPRYTPALCFLEARGFERFKDCVNLLADLTDAFETAGEHDRLAKLGIAVRRAGPVDDPLLVDFFAQDFGGDWLTEARLAMRNDPPGLHLALKDGKIIGFSAHSGQNREWGFFGPMGTTPDARGTGIGRVLLRHCLNDMRAAGHKTSVIPWVGPIGFYSRYCRCRVERVFWRYRRAVSEPSMPAT